jgi:single-strand DNA-binding protein
MNSVNIVARLTRDPELRATAGGTSVCSLSVAVNEKYKDAEHVSYLDIDTFGTLADNCALYLTKGRQVAVSGRLRQERWEQQDGQKRSKVKIIAHDVQFLGAKEGASPDTKADVFDRAKEMVKTDSTFADDEFGF